MKKLNSYNIGRTIIDSLDLKCLVNTRGVHVEPAVISRFEKEKRVSLDPRYYSSFCLSDGISVVMRDSTQWYEKGKSDYRWHDAEKSLYKPQLETPFSVKLEDDVARLYFEDTYLDEIVFPAWTDYYEQKTSNGIEYKDLSTLQGDHWNSWAYLWPCQFALEGHPCQFCAAGAKSASDAAEGLGFPRPCPAQDFVSMLEYSVKHANTTALQITGGSTYDGNTELRFVTKYLDAIADSVGWDCLSEDILLYVTPPSDLSVIDEYFRHGAKRIACSVEVWNEDIARIVTPKKMAVTTRKRHLDAWEYIVDHYGVNKGFTNFILGIEPFEDLEAGVRAAAERGIYPGGCIWSCSGRACNGKVMPPGLDYYKRCKELFFEIYEEYGFVPDRTPMPNDFQAEIYHCISG